MKEHFRKPSFHRGRERKTTQVDGEETDESTGKGKGGRGERVTVLML